MTLTGPWTGRFDHLPPYTSTLEHVRNPAGLGDTVRAWAIAALGGTQLVRDERSRYRGGAAPALRPAAAGRSSLGARLGSCCNCCSLRIDGALA